MHWARRSKGAAHVHYRGRMRNATATRVIYAAVRSTKDYHTPRLRSIGRLLSVIVDSSFEIVKEFRWRMLSSSIRGLISERHSRDHGLLINQRGRVIDVHLERSLHSSSKPIEGLHHFENG